jgi:hypothetical protein
MKNRGQKRNSGRKANKIGLMLFTENHFIVQMHSWLPLIFPSSLFLFFLPPLSSPISFFYSLLTYYFYVFSPPPHSHFSFLLCFSPLILPVYISDPDTNIPNWCLKGRLWLSFSAACFEIPHLAAHFRINSWGGGRNWFLVYSATCFSTKEEQKHNVVQIYILYINLWYKK